MCSEDISFLKGKWTVQLCRRSNSCLRQSFPDFSVSDSAAAVSVLHDQFTLRRNTIRSDLRARITGVSGPRKAALLRAISKFRGRTNSAATRHLAVRLRGLRTGSMDGNGPRLGCTRAGPWRRTPSRSRRARPVTRGGIGGRRGELRHLPRDNPESPA